MNENAKIILELQNGDKLVAEDCTFTDGGQIAVGIIHDDVWIQDLAVIETKCDDNGDYEPDKFNVYVYGNEYQEDFTDKYEINRVPSNAL